MEIMKKISKLDQRPDRQVVKQLKTSAVKKSSRWDQILHARDSRHLSTWLPRIRLEELDLSLPKFGLLKNKSPCNYLQELELPADADQWKSNISSMCDDVIRQLEKDLAVGKAVIAARAAKAINKKIKKIGKLKKRFKEYFGDEDDNVEYLIFFNRTNNIRNVIKKLEK